MNMNLQDYQMENGVQIQKMFFWKKKVRKFELNGC